MKKALPTKYNKKLIRHFLKREKKPLYTQISNILEIKNDLSAREIASLLYSFSKIGDSSTINPFQQTQLISNISKDFNEPLANKLSSLNITRYFNEQDQIFKYIKN